MKGSLERRLAALEAKAKPPMIATWVDLMLPPMHMKAMMASKWSWSLARSCRCFSTKYFLSDR
jgi:hypothetical protein